MQKTIPPSNISDKGLADMVVTFRAGRAEVASRVFRRQIRHNTPVQHTFAAA
jgi:hypothetical protein